LDAGTAPSERLARDPIGLVHRYALPRDQEIAGICAAQLAYGRVDLFLPVLERLFDHMDTQGGPRAYVMAFLPGTQAGFLEGCAYRWTKGRDWSLFFSALRVLLEEQGSLKRAFEAAWAVHDELDATLESVVEQLRQAAISAHGSSVLPRGTRYFMVAPSGGSACKRWMLFLRWMSRPADGVDLGLFDLPASALLIPLDTHVHRIGRFLGFTKRKDTSWRTAKELTAALAKMDVEDPTRFDFALAHVGISSGCVGQRRTAPCKNCDIRSFCKAPLRRKRIGFASD
jgi:uncharacterized protein (TIGR02757 family)